MSNFVEPAELKRLRPSFSLQACMTDISHFPTVQMVQSALLRLRQSGFPRFQQGDNGDEFASRISKILTNELNVLPNIPQFDKVSNLGFKLFRVRELGGISNRELPQEYSYTPVNLARKVGRCNLPYHPVFYCSSQPMVALAEVVKNDNFENKRYVISRWNAYPSEDRMVLEPFTFCNLPSDNHFNILKNGITAKLPGIFENRLTKDQEEGLKLYLEFLSESFLSDEEYSLSASLAHRRLYAPLVKNSVRTHVLLYPSVQTRYIGINMAIHPAFVDKYLYPDRFYEVEISSLDKEIGSIKVSFSKYGESTGGSIQWFNIHPHDLTYQKYIRDDFNFEEDFVFTAVT